MGTHRSKHNKGRKPFYKNHDRTTLADLAPAEAGRWEDEAEQFLHDRALNIFREGRAPPKGSRGDWKIPKPDPALLPVVKRYLEVRKQVDTRKAVASEFPKAKGQEFEFVGNGPIVDIERVHPSQRDVLMELFVDRTISVGQLHAGRRWQAHREWATLQPSVTVDWSKSGSYPYQSRGTLTEGQFGAMKYRRVFREYAGAAAVSFLDFCLDADRGRAELMAVLKIDRSQLGYVINDLLGKLCACFGDQRRAA